MWNSFVMKTASRICLALMILGTGLCAAAETLIELQGQWQAINSQPPPRKFDQLIPKLLAYREQAGGKSWQLNYMLGTSYCRTAGQEKNGRIALYRVLGSYGLPDAARIAAERVLADCGRQSISIEEPSFSVVPVSGQLGAMVHGKGGYEVDLKSMPTTNKLQVSPVPVNELRQRVFTPDRSAEAVKAAVARSRSTRGGFVQGFVITSSGELPPQETGYCLARYRSPLEKQFGMVLPKGLITVYTVEPDQVAEYARRLHGVTLPLGTVAYSVYEDLSIVGITSLETCGSLAHELVHLFIRQNFSDSPAWLEEGLASEVAVARPEQTGFRFNQSWRDEALQRHWADRPSVSELLKKTWADYGTNDISQVNRVTALHAMAACFVRYLDARQKLVPIYSAMRDSLSSSKIQTDEEILAATLGMSLDEIDKDFVRWFSPAPRL